MDPTNTTDLPACASQDGAHPPIALTADAGAQTGRPVILAAEWPDARSFGTAAVEIDGESFELSIGIDDGAIEYHCGVKTAPYVVDGLPEWVGPVLADRVEAALYDAYVAQVAS